MAAPGQFDLPVEIFGRPTDGQTLGVAYPRSVRPAEPCPFLGMQAEGTADEGKLENDLHAHEDDSTDAMVNSKSGRRGVHHHRYGLTR